MKKLSLFLCAVTVIASSLLMLFCAEALEMPDFYVNDATAVPGSNVTIEVGVKGLSAEKAMDTFGVTLKYPEGFTYVSSEATAKVTDVCKLAVNGVEEQAYWIEHNEEARTVTLVAVVNTVDYAVGGIAEDGILMTAMFVAPAETSFAPEGYKFSAEAMEGGFVDLTGQTVQVTVTEGNVTKTAKILKGDVNGDGVLNVKDRAFTIRHFAGQDGYGDDAVNKLAGDVNGDGYFNVKDRAIIIRHFAGWDGYKITN